MKKPRFAAALLAGLLLLSLTACGGVSAPAEGTAPAASPEPVQEAEHSTQDAAYYNAEYGLIVRQWTEPFRPYAEHIFVEPFALDPGVGDYIGALIGCDIANSEDPNGNVVAYYAFLISSNNPSAREETALALAKRFQIIGDDPDARLETFPTDSGQTLWLNRYAMEGSPYIQGTPTPEQLAGFTAMYQGLDQQLAQIEMVAPKLGVATGSVSFTTVDLDGNPVDSSVFANDAYTMINIWGSFCAPCIGEMEDLMRMDAELENVQIITILGDATSPADDTAEDAREIVETLNLTLPVYLINREIASQLPYAAFPTSFLVDRQGNPLGSSCVGAVGVERYKAWIARCIGETEP